MEALLQVYWPQRASEAGAVAVVQELETTASARPRE